MNTRMSRYGVPVSHRRMTGEERYNILQRWKKASEGTTTTDAAREAHFVTLYLWQRIAASVLADNVGLALVGDFDSLRDLMIAALETPSESARHFNV